MISTRILCVCAALLVSGCSTMKNLTSTPQGKPRTPSLKDAEVKTIWIPDKIEGNRFEEGHYLHLIDKQTTWRAE